MSWKPPRRSWSAATVRETAGGFAVDLDARPLNTPDKRPLVVPTAGLARAVAAEWNALTGVIDPGRLPFTRAVNTAIDRLPGSREPVVDALAAYGGADLICYRAETPAALQARQAEAWDPWLAWARRALDAPLVPAAGVMPQPQPAASLMALRRAVDEFNDFGLAGLDPLVTLSGSLVLGLAVARGALGPGTAWELSRLDEAWQAEQWGIDAEAEVAAARKAADFLRAAEYLTLLGEDDARMGKP